MSGPKFNEGASSVEAPSAVAGSAKVATESHLEAASSGSRGVQEANQEYLVLVPVHSPVYGVFSCEFRVCAASDEEADDAAYRIIQTEAWWRLIDEEPDEDLLFARSHTDIGNWRAIPISTGSFDWAPLLDPANCAQSDVGAGKSTLP